MIHNQINQSVYHIMKLVARQFSSTFHLLSSDVWLALVKFQLFKAFSFSETIHNLFLVLKFKTSARNPTGKKQVSEMIPWQSLSKQQHYPAAIGLEWLVHIPSRCVQQCGIWSRVSWCSRHAPAAGWCSAPDTEDEARSRHGRMPAVPEWSPEHGSARLLPGRYARPGRPSTRGWCRPCSEVGPTTDAYHQHSAINKQVKAPVHK